MGFRLPIYKEFLSANSGLVGSATFQRGYSAYTLVRGDVSQGQQQRLGWEDAERRARRLGGNLATINDAAENSWITSTYSPIAFDPCGLWIGLNDLKADGRWEWSSGQQASFRNWVPAGTPGYPRGEPTNGPGEDYVHIYFNPDAKGRWKDTNVGYRDVALGGGIAEIPIARLLRGGNGSQTLKGGEGPDRIIGGNGTDILRGLSGNDDLVGGARGDVMTGGGGGDYFILTSLTDSAPGRKQRDRITDFDGKEGDRVDLSEIRGLKDFAFIKGKSFSGKPNKAPEVRFESGLLEVDANGNGKADLALVLSGVTRINSDWIL